MSAGGQAEADAQHAEDGCPLGDQFAFSPHSVQHAGFSHLVTPNEALDVESWKRPFPEDGQQGQCLASWYGRPAASAISLMPWSRSAMVPLPDGAELAQFLLLLCHRPPCDGKVSFVSEKPEGSFPGTPAVSSVPKAPER